MNKKKISIIEVAATAMMLPPTRLQKTAWGRWAEKRTQEASVASTRITQASIMRKKTMEPMAAERRILKLMRARCAA